MSTIKEFLTDDHRACDDKFADMENIIAKDDWSKAEIAFKEFESDLNHHFDMEERVMFPTFEERTGMSGGPTMVMRMEHQQMLQVLSQMKDDIANKDKSHFFGLSESLMMLMQQHNMKEEQMLYAMADAHLSDIVENVITRMKEVERN